MSYGKDAGKETTDKWVAAILAKVAEDVNLALAIDPPTPMPQRMEMEVKAVHNDSIKITIRIDLEQID